MVYVPNNELKNTLARLNISRLDLANWIGKSPSTVAGYLAGYGHIHADVLNEINEYLRMIEDINDNNMGVSL